MPHPLRHWRRSRRISLAVKRYNHKMHQLARKPLDEELKTVLQETEYRYLLHLLEKEVG
jgi:hypothetical protein